MLENTPVMSAQSKAPPPRVGSVPRAALLAAALLVSAGALAAPAGETTFARGAATAQSTTGKVTLLGKGVPVNAGDVLSTGPASFAVVRLRDGTSMTLRPDTVFKIESYQHDQGNEGAVMRLFRGGLRAVTGLIARRNPEGMKLQTAVATIGIRGTDFSARVCGQDCVDEAKRHGVTGTATPAVAGRVAFLRGSLDATGVNGDRRRVLLGGSFYAGDTLETPRGSLAVLAFRDETRVTVQPGTQFRVEDFAYEKERPEQGSVAFRLLRGGLRAVTGLIGRARPEAYKVATPVATIGIRGTAFDLICQGACVRGGQASLAPLGAPLDGVPSVLTSLRRLLIPDVLAQGRFGDGMFLQVLEGIVEAYLAGLPSPFVFSVDTNRTGFFSSPNAPPILGVQIPANILQQLGPDPRVIVIPPEMFGTKSLDQVDPGALVLAVFTDEKGTGDLTVVDLKSGKTLNLGAGEGGVVGGTEPEPVRTEGGPPLFELANPFNFSPNTEIGGTGLLGDGTPKGNRATQCEVGG